MDEAVVVESQPTDVSVGPLVSITSDERAEFRRTGNLPEKQPKPEEAAPSSEPIEAKSAGDSEPPKQEKAERKSKGKTADERIAELEATIEKIKKGAGKETKAVPSPAPEPKADTADKEPSIDDTNADGTPKWKSYEEFSKAQARWEVRQELAEQRRIEAQQKQEREFAAKMAEAESRYENFADIADPFAGELLQDQTISPVVKQMFRDSEVMADLVFTIASKEQDRADFLKMAKENPGKAIRYIALTESLIADELAKPKQEASPEKPKTQAPKPPSEAGGRAAAPPDALDAAAKANDFRAFKAEATRRQLAKLKS